MKGHVRLYSHSSTKVVRSWTTTPRRVRGAHPSCDPSHLYWTGLVYREELPSQYDSGSWGMFDGTEEISV